MVPERINKKRLTKKETQALIENGALLDDELSQLFSLQDFDKRRVYHLPDDTILFVYESYPAGKSDVYSEEVFKQWVIAVKASKRYGSLGINSSFNWYLHFSRYKTALPQHIDKAIEELRIFLGTDPKQFDYSLKSLDLLSERIRTIGIENNEPYIVDGLVAYCGEIIRQTMQGEWKHLDQEDIPAIFKEVSWFFRNNWYHPVNQVWEAFYDPANFPLRKVIRKFHVSKREDKVQKVQIMNSEINGKLQKSDTMENNSNKSDSNNQSSSSTTTTTTQLPGVNTSQVISSSPKLIKENSQNSSTKKK